MLPVRTPLQLHYPISTAINCNLEFRPRRLVVYKFRDLVTDPLTIAEYMRRPLLYRGRWLAIAKDLQAGVIRQVYPTTTREHFRVVPVRLGLYDPDKTASGPVDVISRAYGATVSERTALIRLIHRVRSVDAGGLQLRVLVDDLRLVGA